MATKKSTKKTKTEKVVESEVREARDVEVKPKSKDCTWLDNKSVIEDMVAWTGDAKRMKEVLCSQPTVTFQVPLAEGEKTTHEVVIINGYKLLIKKGVTVELPKQVAQLISDHYRLTLEAVNSRKVKE